MPSEEEIREAAERLRQAAPNDEAVRKRIDELAGRMTADGEVPPLILRREELVFSAGGHSVTIKLAPLLGLGEKGLVPLLLWGILLKLHDLETSFRAVVKRSEERADEVLKLTGDPANLVDHVRGVLAKLGVEAPGAIATAAKGTIAPPRPPDTEERKLGGNRRGAG